MVANASSFVLQTKAHIKRRFIRLVFVLLLIWQAGAALVAFGAYLSTKDNRTVKFDGSQTQLELSLIHPTPLQVADAFQRVLIDRARVWKADQDQMDFQPDVSGIPLENQAAEFERKTKRLNALRELHLNHFWSGCDYFRKSKHYEDHHAKSICTHLELYGPPDLTIPGQLRRYEHKASLDYPYGSSWRMEELWDILDDCRTPQEMLSVLNRARDFCTQEYRIWRTATPCSFNTALARLNSAFNGDRGAIGQAIAVLADAAQEEKDDMTALFLYRLAGLVAPSGPAFGRCAFNQGYLLRRDRCPRQAVSVLLTIFPSNANDQDRGQHLMEAYRNYRHRAALEIASAYADMYNYPTSFYYQWLAAYRYEYGSWCGTCRWGEDAAMRKRLINTSLAAGPLFAVANVLIAPISNWRIWLILVVIYWGSRKFICRRDRISTELNAGTDTYNEQ